MTKNARKAQKIAWNNAIREGRVVCSNGGLTFREYKTAQEAREVLAGMINAGHLANIVDPAKAQ